jgi:oligosaccharide repeat unit polymerase
MAYHFISLLCLLQLAAFNYRTGRKNVLYPPFLFSMIWLVVLSLYFLLFIVPLMQMSTLGVRTLFIVVGSVVAFTAGGMVFRPRRYSLVIGETPSRESMWKKALFFGSLAALPAFYLEIRSLAAAGGLDGFLISARAAMLDQFANGESQFGGPLNTIAPLFAIFVAFIFLIEMRDWRRERPWMLGSILSALIFCILTTGRAGLLKLVVGLAGIFLLKKRLHSLGDAWKFMRWAVTGFLVLCMILIPLVKDVSSIAGGDLAQAAVQLSVGYIVLPLAGFDYMLYHPEEHNVGSNHTLREVAHLFAALSGSSYTPPPEDGYLEVPLFTNVFTVFKALYFDFGTFGLLIIMFLLGIVHTWLFWKAVKGIPLFIFLYAMSLYPLSMVPFDETYSLLGHYLAEIVFAILYFKILRRTWIAAPKPRPSSPKVVINPELQGSN